MEKRLPIKGGLIPKLTLYIHLFEIIVNEILNGTRSNLNTLMEQTLICFIILVDSLTKG